MERQDDYSRYTHDVLTIYNIARWLFITWIAIICLYSLGELLYETSNSFSTIARYWPLTLSGFNKNIYILLLKIIVITTKSFPFFFISLFTGISLKSSRMLLSNALKPLLVFWFVQGVNFVFVLPNISNEFTVDILNINSKNPILGFFTMFLIATPFVIYTIYKKYAFINKHNDETNYIDLIGGKITKIPHNFYIGIISLIIALVFDINLQINNIHLSHGIVFGLLLSIILLSQDEMQKLLLYFLSPETYLFVHRELKISKKHEMSIATSEMVNKQSSIAATEANLFKKAVKTTSSQEIQRLISIAEREYMDAFRFDTSEKIEKFRKQLEKKEIDYEEFKNKMEKLLMDIQDVNYGKQIENSTPKKKLPLSESKNEIRASDELRKADNQFTQALNLIGQQDSTISKNHLIDLFYKSGISYLKLGKVNNAIRSLDNINEISKNNEKAKKLEEFIKHIKNKTKK